MIVSTFPLEHPRHYLTLLIRKNEVELEMNALANTVGWHRHVMDARSIACRKQMPGVCCACAEMAMFPGEANSYPLC